MRVQQPGPGRISAPGPDARRRAEPARRAAPDRRCAATSCVSGSAARTGGRARRRQPAADRRLQDAQLGDRRVAEIRVDALDDLARLVLHIERAGAVDPQAQASRPERPFGGRRRRPPSVLDAARPFQALRRRVARRSRLPAMAGQSVTRLAVEKPYFSKALRVSLGRKLPTALMPKSGRRACVRRRNGLARREVAMRRAGVDVT